MKDSVVLDAEIIRELLKYNSVKRGLVTLIFDKDAKINEKLLSFKTVKSAGNGGRITLPASWVGKRVAILLLDLE